MSEDTNKNLASQLFMDALKKDISKADTQPTKHVEKMGKAMAELNILIGGATIEGAGEENRANELMKEALQNSDLIMQKACEELNIDFPSLIHAPIQSLSGIEPNTKTSYEDVEMPEEKPETNMDRKQGSLEKRACIRRTRR